MNVLIIELGGSHAECIYSTVHFLKHNHCEVHVACNESLVRFLPESLQLSGILDLPNHLNFFRQIQSFIQIRKYISDHRIDTIIINTTEIKVVRNLSLVLPRKNTIGLVHNAQKLKNSSTFSKILYRKIKKYLVLSDYLLTEIDPLPKYNVSSFYPIYFPKVEILSPLKSADEYWITIPGIVNLERRDYLSLVHYISKHTFPENIKFIFLGKFNEREDLVTALADSGVWHSQIKTFDYQLEYNEFHSYIQQSDLMLPLINSEANGFYGNTRISGTFNLGLGYKKPFLLNRKYESNKDLSCFSHYYDTMEELAEIILHLYYQNFNDPAIQDAYQESIFNDMERMSIRFYDFVKTDDTAVLN